MSDTEEDKNTIDEKDKESFKLDSDYDSIQPTKLSEFFTGFFIYGAIHFLILIILISSMIANEDNVPAYMPFIVIPIVTILGCLYLFIRKRKYYAFGAIIMTTFILLSTGSCFLK